jgi:hypothetical protein
MGRTVGVRFLVEARDFSLLHIHQTGSEALQNSDTKDIVGSVPGDKADWR